MAYPAVTPNSPQIGFISWAAFSISYLNQNYSIPAGNTAMRWVWWRWNGGGANSILEAGNEVPTDLTDDDLVILGNKNGIPVRVYASSFVDGELLVDGSVISKALAADAVTTQHLIAGDALVQGLLQVTETVSEAVSTNGLFVGSGISITNEEGIQIETPIGTTKFPADGGDIELKANVVAAALQVLGQLAVRGTNNEISKNASITLETGVTAPKVGPTISAEYDVKKTHEGFLQRGFAFHSGSNRYIRIESADEAVISPVYRDGVTGNYDFAFESFSLTKAGQGGRTEINSGIGGCVIVGDELYVLCTTREAWPGTYQGRFFIYRFHYNGSGVPLDQRWSYVNRGAYLNPSETTALSSRSEWHPALGWDGSNLIIVQAAQGGDHYRTSYNTLLNRIAGPVLIRQANNTPFNMKRHVTGVYIGEADHGAGVKLHIVHESYPTCYVFNYDSSHLRQSALEFPLYTVGQNRGIYWDGTRFIMPKDKTVIHHSQIRDNDLASNPINAKQTWRLRDGVSPDFAAAETAPGPRSTMNTFPKRAFMRLRSPVDIPDDTADPSDANAMTFYIARGAAPADSAYRRIDPPAIGVSSILLDVLPTAGGAPPAATYGFAAGVPARYRSAAEDAAGSLIDLRGDGKWRLRAQDNLEDTGWINATLLNGWQNYGGVNPPAQYRRIGNRVFLRGLVRLGTTTAAIFNLPAGFRPTYTSIQAGVGSAQNVAAAGDGAKNIRTGPPTNSTASHTHDLTVSAYDITVRLTNTPVRVDVTTAGDVIKLDGTTENGFVAFDGMNFFID